jgi:hypothetical protein
VIALEGGDVCILAFVFGHQLSGKRGGHDGRELQTASARQVAHPPAGGRGDGRRAAGCANRQTYSWAAGYAGPPPGRSAKGHVERRDGRRCIVEVATAVGAGAYHASYGSQASSPSRSGVFIASRGARPRGA